MKVKELIEQLQALDPDLMVICSGYEGGFSEIGFVDEQTIALNVHEDWYYGEHERVDEDDKYEGHEHVKAVYIR